MKKRLLSLLMVLTMLATLLPVGWVSAAEETADTETIQLPASSIQLPYSLIQDGNAGIKSHDNARDGQFLDNMVRNDVVCLARDLDLTGLEQIVLSVAHAQTAGVKYGFYIDGHKDNLGICIAYATGVKTSGWQDFTEIVAEWTDAAAPAHLSGTHDLFMRVEGDYQLGGNYDYVDLTIGQYDVPETLEMETLFDDERSATTKADIGTNDAASGGEFIDHTMVNDRICLGEHDLTDLDEIVMSLAYADPWVKYGFYVDGTDTKIAEMKANCTDGWSTFKAFSAAVAHDLPTDVLQGIHTLYLKIESSAYNNGGNLDTLQLIRVKPIDSVVYTAKKIKFAAYDAATPNGRLDKEDNGNLGSIDGPRVLLGYNNVSFDGLNSVALEYLPQGATEVNLYKGDPDNGGEKFASFTLDNTDLISGDEWWSVSNRRTTPYNISGHGLTGTDTLYFEFIKKSDFVGNLASFTLYYEKVISVPAEKIILTEDMVSSSGSVNESYTEKNMIDGNRFMYWESNSMPATLMLDLKSVYMLDHFLFMFDLPGYGTRDHVVKITGGLTEDADTLLTAEETVSFTFAENTNNVINIDLLDSISVRYVKLEFLSGVMNGQPMNTMAFGELEVYGYKDPDADIPIRVAVIGDSITEGAGASSAARNYVSQLQALLGVEYAVCNFGKSGKTCTTGIGDSYDRTTEYQNSQSFQPDVVTIMLGTNDSKTPIWDAAAYERDLQAMVKTYQELKSHPLVIIATSPTTYANGESDVYYIRNTVIRDEVAPIQRQIAKELDCPLIDINEATKEWSEDAIYAQYLSDRVHPNDAGHTVLAKLFANGIAAALEKDPDPKPPAEKIILTEKMVSATSEAGADWAATKVVDGNATKDSYWESNGLPATLSVNLKKVYAPDSLVFKFDLSGTSWGTRTQTLHVTGSLDGLTFSPLTDEETITLVFEGSKANAIKVKLNATTGIRYIHLEFLTTTEPKPNAQLAELEAYGEETTAPVDKTNLKALIAGVEASAGDQDRYTDDSLATLMSAYTTAKQVDANENATQKEVDDATAALDAAIKGLQLKPTPDPEPPTEELARPNSLLVLGDSIANGDASSQRYGDLIAADLGLQQNVAYFNQAVGGHTTSDCLTIAQNIPVNLGAPDVISVSIGGNDVQYALWNAPLASNKTELLALIADREANQARIEEVQAKQQELGNDPTCLANIERAGENINKIFAALLEKFPTSTIIIQTVYNPFNWDESFCVELPVIDKLNVKIKEVAAKYDQVMVLDVAAGFEKKGSQYIANDLMHPNETGHAAIAEMYMNLWPKSDEEGPHYTMTNVSSFFDWGQDGSVVEYGGGYCWKFNNGKALALNGYTGVLTDGVSITYEIDMQVGNPGGAYSMFYGYYEGVEAKQTNWYVTDFSEAVGKWHTFKFTVDSYAASQNYAGSPLVIFGYHDNMYVRSFKVYETNNPEKEVSIVFGNVEEPDAGKDVTVKFLVDDNTNFVAAEQMVTSAAELRTLYENTKVPQLWGYTTAGWDESLETLVASYDSAEEGATLVVSAVYTVDTEKTYSVTATNASTVKVGGQTVDTTVEGLTFDTRVEVTAADMLEGQSFSYWTLDGVPVCQNKSFTFYVSGNNTIEAVYGASAPTDPAVAVKHDNYITHEGNGRYTWSVVAQVFAPVGKTVTEYGVIFAPANVDLAAGFVGGTLVQGKDYLMVKASSTDTNRQYMISLIHIQAGATRQAVAYCVDSNGGYHFSEIKTKTMPTVAP